MFPVKFPGKIHPGYKQFFPHNSYYNFLYLNRSKIYNSSFVFVSRMTVVIVIAVGFLLFTPAVANYDCTCENELYRKIPGGLKHATTSVNYLWGVNTNDDIFVCSRPCTGGWKHIGGKLMQIDAGRARSLGCQQRPIYL